MTKVWPLLLPLLGAVAFFALYFLPADLASNLLAPGDGVIYYLPALTRPWALWSDLLMAGYPVAADLQSMAWYPPAQLLGSFNAIVISAYVIAATGMYAHARAVTGSRLGATYAALVLSTGAFMVAHLGHLTIIHAAAWAPWLLWSVREVFRGRAAVGIVGLAVATFMTLTAGHPQISVYALTLAGAYALLQATQGERRLAGLGLATAGVALGIALAAVALLPFVELAGAGPRQAWSIADFGGFSLTVPALILTLFPHLFGSVQPFVPYFGPYNYTELAIYTGLFPVVLASLALTSPERRETRFWIGVAVASLVLCLGTSTPLGRLVFELPVFGKFRAQARFGLLLAIAVAMLAGFGVARLEQGRMPAWTRAVPWLFLAIMLFAGAVVIWQYQAIAAAAASVGRTLPTWNRNPAFWIPLALAVVTAAMVWALTRAHRTRGLLLFGLAFCAIDLGSFGRYYEWRYASIPKHVLQAPDWQPLIGEISASGNRIAPVGGYTLGTIPVTPNLSSHFGLPSIGAYGPLMPARYSTFSGADSGGNFPDFSRSAPMWDVLAVGWIAGATGLDLGVDCGGQFGKPQRVQAQISSRGVSGVRLVSNLACSTAVEQGAVVGEVTLSSDHPIALQLRAGVHSSEWAIDRPDVAAIARHQRATIHSSFGQTTDPAHWYVADLIADAPVDIQSISIAAQPVAMLRLAELQLLHADGTVEAVPLSQFSDELGAEWSAVASPAPLKALMRRSRALPRAWLVHAATPVTQDAVRRALAGGALEDGTRWNPYEVALIDPPGHGFDSRADVGAKPGTVEILDRDATRWHLRVQSPADAMLVFSQSYYPGWRALVGGQTVEVLPVDGLIQGVRVPRGTHDVELFYRPRSFSVGAGISGIALVLLALLCARLARRRNPVLAATGIASP